MSKYAEMPAAEFSALLREKASRDNRELLDEAARRIDHKETNAEKLAKDTETMVDIIGAMCSAFYDCEGCPLKEYDGAQEFGMCKVVTAYEAKMWLESEVEE